MFVKNICTCFPFFLSREYFLLETYCSIISACFYVEIIEIFICFHWFHNLKFVSSQLYSRQAGRSPSFSPFAFSLLLSAFSLLLSAFRCSFLLFVVWSWARPLAQFSQVRCRLAASYTWKETEIEWRETGAAATNYMFQPERRKQSGIPQVPHANLSMQSRRNSLYKVSA